MFILGLTGSIGMGKTTTARLFAEEGVPVHDSDAAVHRLYEGDAVAAIEQAFPGTTANGKVDRQKLGAMVVNDAAALKRLEGIVHPLVRQSETKFLEAARARGESIVVLDIPLLYETGGEKRVDAVVVVTAPAEIQRQRVLERPGMTPDKLDSLADKADAGRAKSARAPISSWIAGMASSPRANRCATFCARLLHCRRNRSDSAAAELHARNRIRYGNHRPRSGAGPSPGGDRLRRAAQSFPDRQDIPSLSQSRTRHAGRGVQRARPRDRVPERASAIRRRSPTSSWLLSGTRRWSRITAISISISSMPNSSARRSRYSGATASSTR